MSVKSNDWFAVLMNAEDKNVNLGKDPLATLYSNGINPDNTGMKGEDYYKNIPQVQNKFRKENGEFDEDTYKQFYTSALKSYNEFTEIPFIEQALNDIGVTPYDSSRLYNPNATVKNVSATITPFRDKNRTTYGTANLWETGSPTFSDREVAQANFVRDEEGNVLDWTPNDKAGILKSLFAPALAYATYDEDEFDNEGRLIHQKGELKLDDEGDPYTQLVGKTESAGKDLVKWTDIMSVEGTFGNKLDVFDSDGFEKSAWKTIAKTAIMLTPYFTPAAAAMGWINAGIGLTSALPGLVKSLNGLITNDSENGIVESMNWLDNVMGRFKPSVSDAAKGKFFSLENIGDMIVSSAGQLYSQKQIAQKLHGWAPFKNPETNKKFAQGMSLGYMALTSSSEAYNNAREAGANERTAGLVSTLTMGAYYLLLNQGYFKDKLFEGTGLDDDIRTVQNVTQFSKYVSDRIVPILKESPDVKGIARAWKVIKDFVKGIPQGFAYETGVYVSRGVNEGLEETMEEVTQDAVTAIAKGLEAIGFDVTENENALDFGWTLGSALERYGTSFLGGFLGGVVFEGLNQKDLRKDPNYKKFLQSTPMRKMYRDIAEGKADKYRKIIKDRYEKQENGNKDLSISRYEDITDSEGKIKRIWQSGTETDNQNLAVTNAMLALVDEAETIYNKYGLIFTNKELVDRILKADTIQQRIKDLKMSEQEYRLKNLIAPTQTEADFVVEALLDLKVDQDGEKNITFEDILAENVLNDVNSIRDEIFNLEKTVNDKLSELPAEKQTEEERKKAIKESSYLKALTEERDNLVKQFQEIIEGKHSDRFLNQTLFFLQDSPFKYWVNLGGSILDSGDSIHNISSFAKFNYGIADFDSLEDSELKAFVEERYLDFKQNNAVRMRRIAEMNMSLSETLIPEFTALNERLKDSKEHEAYLYRKSRELVGNVIADLEEIRNQLMSEIKQKTDAGLEGTPEVTELIEQVNSINSQLEVYSKLSLEARLDEFFAGEIEVTGDSDADETLRRQIVKDFYTKAIEDKAVYVKDDYLRQYLSTKNWDYATETFERIAQKLSSYYNIRIVLEQFDDLGDVTIEAVQERYEVNIANGSGEDDALSEAISELLNLDPDIVNERMENSPSFFRSPLKEQFKDKLQTFINRIKVRPDSFESEFENLVLFVQNTTTEKGTPVFDLEALKTIPELSSVSSVEDFIGFLFNPGGGDHVFDFIQEVNKLIGKTEKSPIFELLHNISMKLTGEPSKILKLIEREKGLISAQRLENYLMTSSAEKEVYNAQAVLNILTALIESAQSGGINELVNTKRLGIEGKEALVVLDPNSAKILANELKFVQEQLDTLKRISDVNRGNKLQENKNIAKYDSVKRFRKLLSPEEGTFEASLNTKLKEVLGKSFKDFVSESPVLNPDFDINIVKSWSEDDYKNFYKNESEFKHNLFVWWKDLSEEDKNTLIEIVVSIGSEYSEIFNMTSDEFSQEIDSSVGSWGTLRYLLSNLFTDFYEFQNFYKSVTGESEFLPFYGQEFVVRDAYSTFVAKSQYNKFMESLLNKIKEKEDEKGNLGDDFIKNMETVKNFLFIDGVPGSGKSSAVAGTLAKVLKLKYGDKLKIVGLIHEDSGSRKSEFAKNLGISESDCYVFGDFVEDKIVSGIKSEKHLKDTGYHISKETKTKLNDSKGKESFDDGIHTHYLFVSDEQTFANEAQLLAFSKWTDSFDSAFLLGLGDMYQSGANTSDDSEITDIYFPASVRLTATFRAENSGKANNEQTAREILKSAFSLWSEDRTVTTGQVSEKIWKSLDLFGSKPLIGFTDSEDGKFYGDISISKLDINDRIRQLLSWETVPSIAIIADNPNDYKEFEASGIRVIDPVQAQGGQWDYCFVDCNIEFGETNNNNYINFKKFYTIMTRSKHGTAWVGSNLNSLIQFSIDPTAKYEVGADMRLEQAKQDYITWRKSLFDVIPESSEIESPVPTPSPSPIPSPTPTPPSVEKEVERFKNIYSPTTDSEVEELRKKYYDSENSEDEKVKDFQKNHGYWVNPYKKRKRLINEGKAFDYDFWWNWISLSENLLDAVPIALSSDSKIQEYKHYLQIMQDYILRWAEESNDKSNVLSEIRAYITEVSDDLKPIHSEIVKTIENGTAYLETRKVENGCIIYLRVNDKAIPLFAQKGVVGGNRYKLSKLKTKFVTRPIPISSNGEKFVPISRFTKKIGVYNDIVIFKGFKENSSEKLSDSAKAFNTRNEGKAFVLVDNVSGDKNFDEWPEYLKIKYSDDKTEIESFIDPNGNRYVSLIGLQKVCTPELFKDLCLQISLARFAKTKRDYDDAIEKINNLLEKTDDFYYVKSSFAPDNYSLSINDLFPQRTIQYLLNVLLRNSTNIDAQIVLKDWLNKGRNSVRLTYGSDSDPKYLIISKNGAKLNVSYGMYNEVSKDPIEIDFPDIETEISTFDYWVMIFERILSNDTIKSYFGLSESNIRNAFSEKTGDRFKLNLEFGRTYTTDTDETKFSASDMTHTFALMAQKSEEWNAILPMFDLFKHNINMKITADSFDDRRESKGVWGTLKNRNESGCGADIVDILPATYELSLGEVTDDSLPEIEWNSDYSTGKLTIENYDYVEENGEFVLQGVTANLDWMEENLISFTGQDTDYSISKIRKTTDGKIEIYVGEYSETANGFRYKWLPMHPEKGALFFAKFNDSKKSYGRFEISNGKVKFLGKGVQIVGFIDMDGDTFCYFIKSDGELVAEKINSDWNTELTNNIANIGELWFATNDFGLYVDSDKNLVFVDFKNDFKSSPLQVDVDSINGKVLSEKDLEDFVNAYNWVQDKYNLNEEYKSFTENILHQLNDLEETNLLELKKLLGLFNSKEEATNAINEYLFKNRFKIGALYKINGTSVAIQKGVLYKVASKIKNQLDSNLEIIDIVSSNSVEFLVSLQDNDGKQSQQTWIYDESTGDVRLKGDSKQSLNDVLLELYNNSSETIRTLIDKFGALSEELSIDEYNDLLDELYDKLDDLSLADYLTKISDILKTYC